MRELLMKMSRTSITTATLVFTTRLGMFPANINPTGSFGFFGNPWLYFLSIILFDQFIGGRYPGFWWTYLGFTAYSMLGFISKKIVAKCSLAPWLLLPTASLLFFMLSNGGVWWHWYPHTLEGLSTCYTLALPFYARTLVGDIIFGYSYLGFKLLTSQPARMPKLDTAQTATA